MESTDFFLTVPTYRDFAVMARPETYVALPDDWLVGTSDIVGSTKAVAEGRYKAVNMVGAAVISAQINAHGGARFPFVFGGDGASFAVPPAWRAAAQESLSAVRVWAAEEFDLGLRVALVPVAEIRAAGQDVRVARYQVSDGVDYAMFSGGGVAWAEAQMKAGAHDLPPAPSGTRPDLEGLSCRWSHMPSRHGQILSVVAAPVADMARFSEIAARLVEVAQSLERAGHPAEALGPPVRSVLGGTSLEAKARPAGVGYVKSYLSAAFAAFLAKVLVFSGVRLGGFDARRYRRVVGENADFRKFDDGLKMTLDCDATTERALLEILEQARESGVLTYGVHRQSEAMMTCIVPSILTDDHVHFVDGAAGGYTAAASQMKGALPRSS